MSDVLDLGVTLYAHMEIVVVSIVVKFGFFWS